MEREENAKLEVLAMAATDDLLQEFPTPVSLYPSDVVFCGRLYRMASEKRKKPSPHPTGTFEGATSGTIDDSGSGGWRALQCKLTLDGRLYHTERDVNEVEHYIDDLDLTEFPRSAFRLVDDSLLPKRHCFSIRDINNRINYYSAHTRDERLLWTTLMKQAAGKVESRGTRYRVDRSVRLRVTEARNLKSISSSHSSASGAEKQSWYVIIEVSGEKLARTVGVFGDGSNGGARGTGQAVPGKQGEPCWMEDFTFNDLGSTGGELMLSVWTRAKKKETKIGAAVVSLIPIKPGDVVEEWFPIMADETSAKSAAAGLRRSNSQLANYHYGTGTTSNTNAANSNHADSFPSTSFKETRGEIKLRIRYDRLSVLPSVEYGHLRQLLLQTNSNIAIDLVASNEHIERLSENLCRLYVAQNLAADWIKSLVEQEVDHSHDTQTLFRGTTMMTKAVDTYMRLVGWQYMDDTVGGVVRWVCDSKIYCELDPERCDPNADLKRHTEELTAYATILWKKVESTKDRFPEELRQLFHCIQEVVIKKFGNSSTQSQHVKYTSVSGFLFLRLFCPAILNPRQFDLVREHPDAQTQRTLTLLAKVIQALGNLTEFGSKEHFMMPMNGFIRNYLRGLMEFIDHTVSNRRVAKPNLDISDHGLLSPTFPARDLSNPYGEALPHAGRQAPTMLPRQNEVYAPPVSPFLIDLDKELASLSIYVVDNKKKLLGGGGPALKANGQPRASKEGELEKLIKACEMVQERVTAGRKEGYEAKKHHHHNQKP